MSEDKQAKTEAEAEAVRVPCEVWARIVGYLRPVQAWNKGKQQEFTERVMFKLDETEDDKTG